MTNPTDKKYRASVAMTEKIIFAQSTSYQHRVQRMLAGIEALLDLQLDLIEVLNQCSVSNEAQQESIVLISCLAIAMVIWVEDIGQKSSSTQSKLILNHIPNCLTCNLRS